MFYALDTNQTHLLNGLVVLIQIWHESIKPQPITC